MNRTMHRTARAIVSLTFGLIAAASLAQSPTGRWTGNATVKSQQVPVHLILKTSPDGQISGTFVNGTETSTSTGGELRGAHIILRFDYFARQLEGDLTADTFTGAFSGARIDPEPVQLHRDTAAPTAHGPTITGNWEIAVNSSKGESAWAMKVAPIAPTGHIKAVILRIDGDTGGLYGSYDPARAAYVISRFGDSGAALYTLKPQPDGTLSILDLLHETQPWIAHRPAVARALHLPPPTRSTEQTTLLNPAHPLTFAGTDLDGNKVASTDPRFKDKVVLVAIGGSWCPNCHDEAPFLVELYKRFHARGLEVVDLSFEEAAQLQNPVRLRAFRAKYAIPYPILLEGTPDDLAARLPGAKNLNCWPTTFFIGRDGLVKQIHAGFSGPQTGNAYLDLKAETEAEIDRLLNTRRIAQK